MCIKAPPRSPSQIIILAARMFSMSLSCASSRFLLLSSLRRLVSRQPAAVLKQQLRTAGGPEPNQHIALLMFTGA